MKKEKASAFVVELSACIIYQWRQTKLFSVLNWPLKSCTAFVFTNRDNSLVSLTMSLIILKKKGCSESLSFFSFYVPGWNVFIYRTCYMIFFFFSQRFSVFIIWKKFFTKETIPFVLIRMYAYLKSFPYIQFFFLLKKINFLVN